MGALPPLGSAGPGDAGGLALRRERSAANEGLTGRSCDGARRGSADAPAPLLSGSYLKKKKGNVTRECKCFANKHNIHRQPNNKGLNKQRQVHPHPRTLYDNEAHRQQTPSRPQQSKTKQATQAKPAAESAHNIRAAVEPSSPPRAFGGKMKISFPSQTQSQMRNIKSDQ